VDFINITEKTLTFYSHFTKNREKLMPFLVDILNVLFTLVIATKLFESQFGKYEIYEITDYKRIINFFIMGDFLAPLCVFIVVHFCLLILSIIIFEGLINLAIRFLKKKFPVKYDEPFLIQLYSIFLNKKGIVGKLDHIINELHNLNLLGFKFIILITLFSNVNGWIYGATLVFVSVIILVLLFVALLFKLIDKGLNIYLRNKNQNLSKVDLIEKN